MRLFSRSDHACALIAAVIAGFALAGCAASDPMGQSLPEIPNRIAYTAVEHDHDVLFVGAVAAPSADETRRLRDFLRTAEARPGDQVAIGAGGGTLDQARRASILAALQAMGLTDIGTAPAPSIPNSVSVVLRQTTAVKPSCGEWPVLGAGDMLNAPASYLGCANANNLYDMVVDKRDLTVGRTPGPADAEPGMRAVQTYREGKSPISDGTGASPAGAGAAGATNAATAAASLAGTGFGMPSPLGSGNGQ